MSRDSEEVCVVLVGREGHDQVDLPEDITGGTLKAKLTFEIEMGPPLWSIADKVIV